MSSTRGLRLPLARNVATHTSSIAPNAPRPNAPKGTAITNWANTISSVPQAIYRPQTRAELRAILRATQGPLRFGGSLHSWSQGAMTEGTFIDMRGFNRVLELDPKQMTVKVEAGIKMEELYEYLDIRGYALASIPSSAQITPAGAMADAVHGSGMNYPATVSDQAVAIELEKTDGSGPLTLTGSSDLAQALGLTDLQLGRTSLGSLGAHCATTFRIVPRYDVDVKVTNFARRDVADRLPELAAKHDHHLFFWYPSVDRLAMQTYDHVDRNLAFKKGAPPYSRTPKPTEHDPALEKRLQALGKEPFRLKLLHLQNTTQTRHLRMPWHIGPREASTVKPHDVSYAVPWDRIKPTMDSLHAMFEKAGWPEVELWVRIVGTSDSALSPAFDGPKAMIEYFPMQAGNPERERALMEQARAIFKANGGKRHWAKEGVGGLDSFPKETVEGFRRLRQKLDPKNRLRNAFTEQIKL